MVRPRFVVFGERPDHRAELDVVDRFDLRHDPPVHFPSFIHPMAGSFLIVPHISGMFRGNAGSASLVGIAGRLREPGTTFRIATRPGRKAWEGDVSARVALDIADPDLSRQLVSRLRSEGYFVVEPEVADLKVTQRRRRAGLQLDVVNHFGGQGRWAFLPLPVPVHQFIATVRRLLPPLPMATTTYSIESDGQGGFQVHDVEPSKPKSGRVLMTFPTYEQAREWIREKAGELPTSGEPPRDYPGRYRG
jgi:hypothetical protein